MSKCAVCNKTAYPLESVTAVEKTFHKACFKCAVCRLQLTLSNFKGKDGMVYCSLHVPSAKATAVSDDFKTKQAMSVPKRQAEGLGNVQKGIGGKPTVAVFGTDVNAPLEQRAAVHADSGYFAPAPQAQDQSCEATATGEAAPQQYGQEQQQYGEQQQQYDQQQYQEQPQEQQY
eukprot:TRINITY_DN90_c0_g1_i2.p1 TRINITY_DN90_c0_g1~~TRINITY_DN90_c0_g1_i2.p1  ORF type:complete len:181 (+),score=31.54 TRINITY_DN90_c0_g1_i2:23-544(+)